MSQEKLYSQLITSLDEKELYTFAKAYLQEVDGLTRVVVTNGPYDSGMDLTNLESTECQYQATIEAKNFDRKLDSDLIKAKANAETYGLPNRVKYFYSHSISQRRLLQLQKLAKSTHNIFLDLYDANRLAQVSTAYKELSDLLLELARIDTNQKESPFFDSTKKKAFYDLMSFGKSTDIKYNIVRSFVLYDLFSNSEIKKEELLKKLNGQFGSKINSAFFENFLGRLSTEKKIKITKNSITLNETEKNRIRHVIENYKAEEHQLITEILSVLRSFDILLDIESLVGKLSNLYECNYSINLGEFTTHETNFADIHTATKELRMFLKSKATSKCDIDSLIKQLICICDNSEILSRIAVGQVYTKVNDPERLQQYINQNINNKDIFLDTNVIINLLLVHYDQNTDYPEPQYQVAKQFLEFTTANGFTLKTIKKYAVETVNIFKDALAIVPFTRMPMFKYLGGSNNILYKFYTYLSDNVLLPEEVTSFSDFLNEFKFRETGDDDFDSEIGYLLDSINIVVKNIVDYNVAKAMASIEDDLKANNRFKNYNVLLNDARMFCRLGDKNVDVNPIDPVFITWDNSLMGARKRYFKSVPDCTRWFMFTPIRFMDHFAMMNFQVKPGSVSNEVLSILDDNHGFQSMTQSLLDSMIAIIRPKDEVGLKFSNKMGELREKEILEVDRLDTNQEMNTEAYPIDKVVNSLVKNYIFQGDKTKSEAFKSLFQTETYFNDIFKIFLDEKAKLATSGDPSDLIRRMDNLIAISIKDLKSDVSN